MWNGKSEKCCFRINFRHQFFSPKWRWHWTRVATSNTQNHLMRYFLTATQWNGVKAKKMNLTFHPSLSLANLANKQWKKLSTGFKSPVWRDWGNVVSGVFFPAPGPAAILYCACGRSVWAELSVYTLNIAVAWACKDPKRVDVTAGNEPRQCCPYVVKRTRPITFLNCHRLHEIFVFSGECKSTTFSCGFWTCFQWTGLCLSDSSGCVWVLMGIRETPEL